MTGPEMDPLFRLDRPLIIIIFVPPQCQSEISTDDEASIVLKVINMLMQLLLRYKLQHLSLSKVEVCVN